MLFIKKWNKAKVCIRVSLYSKIKNGQPKASFELLDNLAKLYGITTDQIVHMDSDVIKEIPLEDKIAAEQALLITELYEKDIKIVFGMIQTILTKKNFKDFFQKNISAL